MPFGWVGGLDDEEAPVIHPELRRLQNTRGNDYQQLCGVRLAKAAEALQGSFFWVPASPEAIQFYSLDIRLRLKARPVPRKRQYLRDFAQVQRSQRRVLIDIYDPTPDQIAALKAEERVELQRIKQKVTFCVPPEPAHMTVWNPLERHKTYVNQFVRWVMDQAAPEPDIHASMCCWEAVFFSAYYAGLLSREALTLCHREALHMPQGAWLEAIFGYTQAFDINPAIGLVPQRGDLLLWDGLEHVAICQQCSPTTLVYMEHWAPFRQRTGMGAANPALSSERRRFHSNAFLLNSLPNGLRFIPCPWGF